MRQVWSVVLKGAVSPLGGQAHDQSRQRRIFATVRVRYGRRRQSMARMGEAAMSVVLHDLLLFSFSAAFVTGVVIAAATLLI